MLVCLFEWRDKFLMYATAAAFCCQLSCFILVLYQLIFYQQSDPVLLSMNVFWLTEMSLGLTDIVECVLAIHFCQLKIGAIFWLTGGTFGLILTATGGIIVNHHVSVPYWRLTFFSV